MCDKIPFFTFFESFVPPRELGLLLHDACVVGGSMDRAQRTMELELTASAPLPEAAVTALRQLLMDQYGLRQLRLSFRTPQPADDRSDVLMGREIKGKPVSIDGLNPKMGAVVIEGKVFAAECYETRKPGVWRLTFDMTDYRNSVTVTKYMEGKEAQSMQNAVSPGMWLRVQGNVELSRDGKDIQLRPFHIMKIPHKPREDTAPEKRVELHLHTKMSNMDALTDTASVIKQAISWGHPAIAITDHGVAQSFPDAWHTAKGKIKILYGVEGYFINNLDDRIAVHGPQDQDFSNEIVCFDIETTGLKVDREAITEIGAVVLKNGQVTDRFQTFVNPGRRLTPEIIGLTGITDAMLSGAPSPKEALTAFLSFVNGRPLAAHNAEFDISFIRAGCRREGIPFDPTYVDSLILAQNLLPQLHKFKLDIVAEYLDLPAFNHHRASDDAAMVAYMLIPFFEKLERELGIRRLQDINPQMLKLRPQGSKSSRFPKHIIILAKNKMGLKHLYQLISASNLQYFKRVPIIPKTELMAHREGLIIGSACEAGELFRAVADHKDWEELKRIASFYDYLEIQPICNNRFMLREGAARSEEELRDFNRTIVRLGEELGKRVVATGDVYGPLFDAFTADTGVEVECLSMSSGEVLSKLRAEGGTPSADLWFGGGIDAFMSAKDDGLLEPVTFDAAAELGDEYKDTEGYWYSKGITIVGFLLNNSLMEELGLTAPESWDDLTDSQYEGEIVMSNPAVSGTNYAVVNALLQAKGDQGWDYFDALNSNIAYYGKRGSDPKNKVSSGEFAVGISYIDASIEQAAEENDLTIVYPSDGMPWVPEGVAVFKNAENVDAAKYFVEWLFSSDDHLRQLAEIEQKNGIKVIKPSIEGIELSYDPTLLMTEDLSLFGSQRTEILDRFEPLMGDKAATE